MKIVSAVFVWSAGACLALTLVLGVLLINPGQVSRANLSRLGLFSVAVSTIGLVTGGMLSVRNAKERKDGIVQEKEQSSQTTRR